jgi:hypothetical protein
MLLELLPQPDLLELQQVLILMVSQQLPTHKVVILLLFMMRVD